MRTVYTSVLLPTGACSGRRFALLPLPCEGIALKNFYFRTKRFLLIIKAVLFQISGLERISLHSGTIFPEFVGPHRNALRGIDATNVNTTTFSVLRKTWSFVPVSQIHLPRSGIKRLVICTPAIHHLSFARPVNEE